MTGDRSLDFTVRGVRFVLFSNGNWTAWRKRDGYLKLMCELKATAMRKRFPKLFKPAERCPAAGKGGRMKDECSGCGHSIQECKCGKPRVVVCAANRSTKTGKIICGARHWDSVMRQQVGWLLEAGVKITPAEWVSAEQGFIDQYGRWMTREEAYQVAIAAGQVKYGPDYSRGTLYSEDLY